MPKPATTVDPRVDPNPKFEKRTRRVFTAEYKLLIIRQADACRHGELGELLRGGIGDIGTWTIDQGEVTDCIIGEGRGEVELA